MNLFRMPKIDVKKLIMYIRVEHLKKNHELERYLNSELFDTPQKINPKKMN